jgi:hypothetical protein
MLLYTSISSWLSGRVRQRKVISPEAGASSVLAGAWVAPPQALSAMLAMIRKLAKSQNLRCFVTPPEMWDGLKKMVGTGNAGNGWRVTS